jgi:uncharacterized repeat protein (TIGR03803 family)
MTISETPVGDLMTKPDISSESGIPEFRSAPVVSQRGVQSSELETSGRNVMSRDKKPSLSIVEQRKITSRTRLALRVIAAAIALCACAWGASTEQVLYAFQGGTDAEAPNPGPLVFDKAGNLYGVTESGGSTGNGAVYELSPRQGGGWTETVLHSFRGLSDGADPVSGVILDAAGNVYGTSRFGGAFGNGTVYQLHRLKIGHWQETVLYSFHGGTDGSQPLGSLVFDESGNLFGTTGFGGNSVDNFYGTVFELAHSGLQWTESVLYSFQGGDDGGNPNYGSLIIDSAGNLYGNAFQGGTNGLGVVFELTPTQGGWQETVLHSFSYPEGGGPDGSPVFDAAGDIYDTAAFGGDDFCNCGTVFKLHHTNSGWKLRLLHAFRGGFDGSGPIPGVVLDKSGNVYGTTYNGGTSKNGCFNACGTVYRIAPQPGGNWKESVIYDFAITGGQTGYNPSAGLILDAAGHLYGTTVKGGAGGGICNFAGCGVVYQLTP